jgi:hypothetical protein
VALIFGATLLPFGEGPFGGMPAERIPPAWCFRCGDLWLTDAFANIALFVPFGFALALQSAKARFARERPLSVGRVLLISLALSVCVEWMQALGLPPGRSAAVADLVTNTVGGGVGALLLWLLRTEASRSRAASRWLAIGWSALAMLVFALSSRALQPVDPTPPAGPLVLGKSPFRHVPGHGWYEGITDSAAVGEAAVGDTVVRRGWSGPIILAASADRLPVTATVWVRRADPLGGQIPLLFVHVRGDSAAWLQIAKYGDDAELTVRRTAWQWGLRFPSIRLRHAFRGRTVGDTSTLGLRAQVTSQVIELDRPGTPGATASLAITPLLGWSLIQPVFTVQSPVAWLAQLGWMTCWLFPVGWWSMRAGGARVAGAVSVGMMAFLGALPWAFRLAPLGIAEWSAVVVSLLGGVIGARVYDRRVGRT